MEFSKNALIVSSPEFIQDGLIPGRFSCNGGSINPPLVIDQLPEGTQSMVLILEDPDAPKGTFTHWVLFDIQPAGSISENSGQGVSGLNSAGKMGYYPLCPPSGIHRYFFHVFALDRGLDLRPGLDRTLVEEAMRPHILASGSLMGRYGAAQDVEAVGKTADPAYRTTVDESGAGAWTTDKKVQH